jgi:hypothetical protein
MNTKEISMRRILEHSLAAIALTLALTPSAFSADADETNELTLPGLPESLQWSFNFDATAGFFGFGNSLYTNPKPDQPSGDLSDDWFEGSAKPTLNAIYPLGTSSELYGKFSVVGERTYGAAPPIVGTDASSFDVEDLAIGWRSATASEEEQPRLDFTFGRARYRLGTGMLLWDGSSEGGTRGGYWTNARQAFELAGIGRFRPGNHTIEAFYLDRDELPESDSRSKLWGANYQYAFGEDTTIGATYMKWSADPNRRPERDGLNVYNLRLYSAPIPNHKALSFELDYAQEDNGAALDSTAWGALVAYQLDMSWQPKVSYRYAFYEGDDPMTLENEAFDPLFTGFSDWGSWWQGEIAGEYFVSNSNLISHQLRVHTKPNDSISTGLIFWDFVLDQPASAGVTSDDVALELDWYLDWSINDNFTMSFVAAIAEPGDAVEQSSGRTDTFIYGMIFAAYSY